MDACIAREARLDSPTKRRSGGIDINRGWRPIQFGRKSEDQAVPHALSGTIDAVADMPSDHGSGVGGLRIGDAHSGDENGLGTTCPRCGYDLRGVVAAWRESCPLSGTCAECGLTFDWEYILRPNRLTPHWCVEFVPRRRGVPWAAAKTLLRSFWPWGFWKRMNMAFPIYWGRLAICMLLLLIVPLAVMYVGVRASAAVYVRWQQQQQIVQMQQSIPVQIAQMQAVVIQPRHVGVNAVIPSLRIAAMFDLQQQVSQRIAMLQRQQQLSTPPPSIEHSYAAAIYEAVFTPFAKQSSGSINGWQVAPGTRGRVRYSVSPSELLAAAIDAAGGSTTYYRSSPFLDEMEDAAGPMAMWLGVLVFMPLSLALLPASRKRAKVRWSHIARVAAYSIFIPITIACATIVVWLLDEFTSFTDWAGGGAIMLVPLFGMPLLGACWWAAAIRRYLRLPHAEAVTALLGLLCLLTTGAAMFWLGQALSG